MDKLPILYPAQPGSPYTTLAADYTSGEATLTLTLAAQLPNAPNLICLEGTPGSGVFRYTGKSGNMLTGWSRSKARSRPGLRDRMRFGDFPHTTTTAS